MQYGIPARGKYRKEVTGIENQLQFVLEIRKRRPGFKVKVVLLVINVFGGGIKEIKELENMLEKKFCTKRLCHKCRKLFL